MKAIILAAGEGTRLKKYTEGMPKGMLPFAGKPLLQHQIETLRAGGIEDIVIVRGFEGAKIQFHGITYYNNLDWQNTNMVETLMCAREEMTEEFLVCYSDILYEPKVLETVLSTSCNVGVTVDMDFLDYWNARLDDPQSDHESLIIENNRITELGTPNPPPEKISGRYVGLLKFSGQGIDNLKRTYQQNPKQFKKAFMTDLLQAMIDTGITITPIRINRGWLEFDTNEDYEKYREWIKTGEMDKFYR